MDHSKQALEAIAEMGMGLMEYNRGVLSAIGRPELAREFKFARHAEDEAASALQKRMDAKHGGDHLASLLDAGREFPESQALGLANARVAAAWKPIQALIDEARAALGR